MCILSFYCLEKSNVGADVLSVFMGIRMIALLISLLTRSSPIEQLTRTHVIFDATVMEYNAKNTEKTIMAAERKFNEKMEKRY